MCGSVCPCLQVIPLALLLCLLGCLAESEQAPLEPVSVPSDLEGMEPLVREQYRELRERLDGLLDASSPSDADLLAAFGDLGNWHHAYRDFERAEVSYRNASALAESDFRWPYYLAQIFRRQGRSSEAIEALEQALDLRSSYVPALVSLGELQLEQGQAGSAERSFAQALDLVPACGRAHYGLAKLALDRGDSESAIRSLEEALRQQPHATDVHYSLGMALRDVGDLERSQRHLSLAQSQDDSARTLAIRDPLMDRVNRLKRSRSVTRVRHAERLFELERYEESARELREIIAQSGDSAELRFLLGLVARAQSQPEVAIVELRRALELDPDHGPSHFQLGTILMRRDQLQAAERHLRRAVERDPGHRQARHRLANLLLADGRTEEALGFFESVIEIDPSNAAAHYGFVRSLIDLTRWQEADRHLSDVLDKLPAAHSLRHLYARLLATSPRDDLRDGELALSLLGVVPGENVNIQHVQTVAMALAAVGRFDEATRWQSRARDAAQKGGSLGAAPWIIERLHRYQNGRAAEEIWAPGENTNLSPLPALQGRE